MFSIRDMNGHWKSRVMWKGGGTSTTTTSSGIDPAFKPELKRALGAATKHTFTPEGDIKIADTVADTGLGQQVASDAVLGRGAFDERAAVDRQLRNLQGQQQVGGGLGSARADRARQAALADAALGFQDRRQQQLTTGAEQLRGLEQEELDAPHKALQRYFGYLGGVGQQQTSTAPKQGGK